MVQLEDDLPLISVIIPTFNEAGNLPRCLAAICGQGYPREKDEIIVIDDYSTDETVAIAERFGARVIFSGFKHIEKSKSLGLAEANGELILFLDADVFLVGVDWLAKATQALVDNPKAVGAQAIYWHYQKNHNIYNRYCELFGTNDPLVYFLSQRTILAPAVTEKIYQGALVRQTANYFLVKFDINNLPTLGSQGCLIRKDLILSATAWQPYFFHLDSIYELAEKGYGDFVLMKLAVEHNYINSFWQFHKKLCRNLVLFLSFRPLRKYTYNLGSARFFVSLFLMVTLIYPFSQSLRGYIKKPDLAWFWHPVFCLTVPLMYAWIYLKWQINHLLARRTQKYES
ncbi:MAG: glycosyltransferase family 2 protein [Patescibacteria group bacterium]